MEGLGAAFASWSSQAATDKSTMPKQTFQSLGPNVASQPIPPTKTARQ